MATLDQDDLDAIQAMIDAVLAKLPVTGRALNEDQTNDAVNESLTSFGYDDVLSTLIKTNLDGKTSTVLGNLNFAIDRLPISARAAATADVISGVGVALEDYGVATTANIAPAIAAKNENPEYSTNLQVFEKETTTQQLVLYLQDRKTPKSLSGFTLEVLFESESGTFVARVAHASITVSGTGSNIVSFAYPAAVTNDRTVKAWSLRDANNPRTVFLSGTVQVLRAANKVS